MRRRSVGKESVEVVMRVMLLAACCCCRCCCRCYCAAACCCLLLPLLAAVLPHTYTLIAEPKRLNLPPMHLLHLQHTECTAVSGIEC